MEDKEREPEKYSKLFFHSQYTKEKKIICTYYLLRTVAMITIMLMSMMMNMICKILQQIIIIVTIMTSEYNNDA